MPQPNHHADLAGEYECRTEFRWWFGCGALDPFGVEEAPRFDALLQSCAAERLCAFCRERPEFSRGANTYRWSANGSVRIWQDDPASAQGESGYLSTQNRRQPLSRNYAGFRRRYTDAPWTPSPAPLTSSMALVDLFHQLGGPRLQSLPAEPAPPYRGSAGQMIAPSYDSNRIGTSTARSGSPEARQSARHLSKSTQWARLHLGSTKCRRRASVGMEWEESRTSCTAIYDHLYKPTRFRARCTMGLVILGPISPYST